MLKNWHSLPQEIQNPSVFPYYSLLKQRRLSLFLKRVFDMIGAIALIMLLMPVMLVVAVFIKLEDGNSVVFKQKRLTTYGNKFYIYKFRTMVENAESLGTQITLKNDQRITRIGRILRKYRLDEFPQLFNILKGEMSFVGTRPEVEKYVAQYTDEMYATLLLPSGVTSSASIEFKDEENLLQASNDPEQTYIAEILPQKMCYNLAYLKEFSIFMDIKIIFRTIICFLG